MNFDRDQLIELPENLPPKLREYVEPFQSEQGRSRLNYAVGTLAFLTFMMFLAVGASRPADPSLGPPTTTTTLPPPKPSRIAGFNEVCITVSNYPHWQKDLRRHCGVHAATNEQKAKGLQGRADLAGYPAMAFTFDADVDAKFHMRNVRFPLTAMFFDAQGRHLGSVDMAPCNRRRCPEYASPGGQKYRTVLEVPQGSAASLGIGPGSVVTVGGGCI